MCFEPGCDIHRSGARMKTHMFKKIRKQIARALTLRHGYGSGLFNLSGFLFSYLTFQECSLHGYLHSTNLYNSHIEFLRFNLSHRRQREIARGITQEQSRRMRRRKRLELKVKYEDFPI